MRGEDRHIMRCSAIFPPEQRVPANHRLRPIRRMVDAVLKRLSPRFDTMYATGGRPSIQSEKLLRALLLKYLYAVRSQREGGA